MERERREGEREANLVVFMGHEAADNGQRRKAPSCTWNRKQYTMDREGEYLSIRTPTETCINTNLYYMKKMPQ